MQISAMVRIKKSKVLSAKTIAAFGAQAKREWNEVRGYRSWFYLNSKKLWTFYVGDKPMCVIGIRLNSLIGTGAEIYFMMCQGFQKHAKEMISFLQRALHRVVKLYGMLRVRVDENFWIGEKFVRFFGFQPLGMVNSFNGTIYNLYELRSAWLR